MSKVDCWSVNRNLSHHVYTYLPIHAVGSSNLVVTSVRLVRMAQPSYRFRLKLLVPGSDCFYRHANADGTPCIMELSAKECMRLIPPPEKVQYPHLVRR